MFIIPNLQDIRDGANFLADTIRRAFEAIQSRIPWTKDDIASVYGTTIDETGWVLNPDSIPWDSAPANQAGAAFINCLDVYRDGVNQYKDDNELFFGPGHLLHRGLFKRQTCNDDGSWVSAVAATLVIPAECPISTGTSTGLAADSWYYVYWKMDAAGEGPEYRISLIPPVRCPGYGPEHPTYEKLRFVGSFRTIADGVIRPFDRNQLGWVIWREIVLGPYDPTYNINNNSGSFIPVDVSDHAPPSADCVHVTASVDNENDVFVRTHGDLTDPAGYHIAGTSGSPQDSAGFIVPVNVLDGATGLPTGSTQISLWSDSSADRQDVAIAGYHEAL